MGESWTEKTVSLDNVDKEEFDSELAHITVSENGIRVAFKDVDDWKRIRREIGDEVILRQVQWEQVDGIDQETDHLYYPHVDVATDDGEKRVFFLEDETEMLEACFHTIEEYWNAFRQRHAGSGGDYSYDHDPEEAETGAEEQEEERLEPPEERDETDEEEDGGEEDDRSDDEEEAAEGDGEAEGNSDRSVEDVVEGFIER